MPLNNELIPIPEKVQRGDFVLDRAAGLVPAVVDQTLRK